MCALRTDYFPSSNRRRCAKSRPSYTEPSDILLSGTVHQDQSRDSFSQNEDSYVNYVESDDGEEEPITIDLSAFLNENPLLAQSAIQCSSESNVAATESSSQFRVTDCEINASEIPRTDVTNVSCSGDVNELSSVDSGAVCEAISPVSVDYLTTTKKNARDNLSSPEKVLSNVINNEPIQSVILNGSKTPPKKFSRSKALGFSNVLKKYKNFFKSKDLNKTNEKVFGKYPVVKCEKLDIENFVKNNKIKVCNWPLNTDNRITISPVKKKTNLSKSTIKPKFIRKPININKYLISNSNKTLTENANNILKKQFASVSSKPIIIRTNPWKPEVANTSSSIPSFLKNFVKTPPASPKSLTSDLLKVRDENVNSITVSPPDNGMRKSILVNYANKLNRSKNYTLIAPKPIVQTSELIVSSPSKPVIGTLTEQIPFNFTVIEPYVDDPSSPQKPKPILTVPVEVLSPEKHINDNLDISAVHSVVENSASLAKSGKSVFMNGVLKQISSPTRITKDICVTQKESNKRKVNQENHLIKVNSKISDVAKEKDSQEENYNVLKAKNEVVDAMQSAFSLTQKKKKIKPRTVRKDSFNTIPKDPLPSCTAYSSILNDFLLHEFSENEFEDVIPFEDTSFSSISHDILTSPTENVLNQKSVCPNNSDHTFKRTKNARKRKKIRRKKSSHEETPFTSDTLSASECENENNSEDNISKKRKASLETVEETKSPPDTSKRNDELDSVKNTFVNHTKSKDLIGTDNKIFDPKQVDSSLPLCNLEKHVITESPDDKINDKNSSKTNKQSETQETIVNKTNDSIENSPDKKFNKVIDDPVKQETCTRTLRERKCSSTEVDKLSDNSVKQSTQQNKNLQEKSRVKVSINSKLKIQLKLPRNTSNGKRKSSKPEDIIQEIKTITGGFSKKEFNKYKRSISSKNINSCISNIKDESESNSSCTSFSNSPSSRSFSKRKKTLKVCIKQSRKKNKSCLKMPLNSLSDVVENANSTSSLSENNSNLHSSFREGKCEKMDAPQKEENSSEKNTSLGDSPMDVDADENCSHEDSLLANIDHPVVDSSTTLLHQDASCTEIVSNSVSDLSVMSENKDNDSTSSIDVINQELKETNNISTSVVSESEEKRFSLLSSNCESNEEKEESTLIGNIEDSVKSVSLDRVPECSIANSECVSDHEISEIKIPVTADDSSNVLDSTLQGLAEKIDNDVSFKEMLKPSENVEKDFEVLESKEKMLVVTEDNISSESAKGKKIISVEEENSFNTFDTSIVDVHNSDNDGSVSEYLLASVSGFEEPLSEQKNKLKDETCIDLSTDNSQTNVDEVVSSDSLNVIECKKTAMPCNDILKNIKQDSELVSENEEESINDSCKSVIFDILSKIEKKEKDVNVSESCKETVSGSAFENDVSSKEILDAPHIADYEQVSIIENSNETNNIKKAVLPTDENISELSFTSNDSSVSNKNKEVDSSCKQKKCPKIKISRKKPDAVSPDSLKNWFVSESKESEETGLLDVSCGVSSEIVDDTVVVSKSSVDNEYSSFSDESLVSDNFKKINNSLSCENSLVVPVPSEEKSVLSDNLGLTEKTASENIKSIDNVATGNLENTLKCPVIIKEEPMDFVENDIGSEETKLCSNPSAVSEPSAIKRPRRSRKSIDTSFDYDIRKVKLEVIDPITPHSKGRKSKVSSVITSTPKATPGRRKNYDPELVCVPFSMGWMREHVIRATGNGKQSDVYYFAPEGNKLRSMPDILAYISKHPNIKLSAKNFTFAKELIYREPFEIERGAKQATPKLNATPKSAGKALKKLKLPVISLNENSNFYTNESPPTDTKKKIVAKRKSSSSVEIKPFSQESKNITKNTKQKSIDQYFNENSEKTEDKLSRPSRKIVKKVPFDNSIDKNGHRKAKSETAIHQNSRDNIKIKIKKENKSQEEPKKESLGLEQISGKSATRELKKVKESKTHNTKSSVPENSETYVNKSPSISMSDDVLLSRTSIKSPVVKNRQAKFVPKTPAS